MLLSTNIGNARLAGIEDSLNMSGLQYNVSEYHDTLKRVI